MTACKNKPVFVVLFGQLIDFVRLQAKVSLFTTEDQCQSKVVLWVEVLQVIMCGGYSAVVKKQHQNR